MVMIIELDFLLSMRVMSAVWGAGLDFIPLVDKHYQHFTRQKVSMKLIFLLPSS